MKLCAMCANPVGRSQVVGIGRENIDTNTGKYMAHPICELCFCSPQHRLRPIKVHFSSIAASADAVRMSNELDEKSKRGEDLTL